jgi:hypothetical protein
MIRWGPDWVWVVGAVVLLLGGLVLGLGVVSAG